MSWRNERVWMRLAGLDEVIRGEMSGVGRDKPGGIR